LVDFVTAESLRAGKAAAEYAIKGGRDAGAAVVVKNGDGVSYTVPQKIRPGNVDKIVEVFFRTTAIYKTSKIEVCCGDNVLASFKREHLAPGEMEKITLTKGILEKASGSEIVISVNSQEKQTGANVTFRKKRDDGITELICIVCPQGCHLQVDEKNDFAVTGNTCARGAEYGKQEIGNPTRVITSTVRIKGADIPRMPVKTDKTIPKGKIFEAMRLLDNLEVVEPVERGDVIVPDICGTGANFVSTRAL
jgi:CxxC motif-containing protein